MSETIQHPKFRWLVMITILIGILAQGIIMIAPSPIIGEVAKALDAELGMVTSIVMGLWTITVCLGGIVGGAVVDKVGLAKIYIVGGILLAISAFGLSFAGKNLAFIVVLCLLGRAGTGPIVTTISRAAAEWFPFRERALITGIQGMANALGISAGMGLAPYFYRMTQSWTTTINYRSIFNLIFIVCAIIILVGPKLPGLAIIPCHEYAYKG